MDSKYQGSLLDAVMEHDTDLLDLRFVKEVAPILVSDPFLFATPELYWVYERYTSYNKFPDADIANNKIVLFTDMTEITNSIYNRNSEHYQDLSILSGSIGNLFMTERRTAYDSACDLFIQEWKKLGKPTFNKNNYFYLEPLLDVNDTLMCKSFIKQLINEGFNINSVNNNGDTILINVSKNEMGIVFDSLKYRIVELLNFGADPNYIDTSGHSFLYYYLNQCNNTDASEDEIRDHISFLQSYLSYDSQVFSRFSS